MTSDRLMPASGRPAASNTSLCGLRSVPGFARDQQTFTLTAYGHNWNWGPLQNAQLSSRSQ